MSRTVTTTFDSVIKLRWPMEDGGSWTRTSGVSGGSGRRATERRRHMKNGGRCYGWPTMKREREI